MRDDLLFYYERELTYMRRLGAEFARKYPKVAGRLLLEPSKCEDPHVERLLEGFAFLAARVHLRMDDDFSEVSEALLGVVYPQHVRPVPSMTIAELRLDPDQGKLASGLRVPRGTPLFARPVQGVSCRFRTTSDVTLWPVSLEGVRWTGPDRLSPPLRATDAAGALRAELRCLPGLTLSQLELSTLRVHLAGDSSVVAALYELLAANCLRVVARGTGADGRPRVVELPAPRPGGFDEEDAVLPHPRRAFAGYRLLQEYFAFPEKYHCFDLTGLEALREAGFGDRAELVFLVSPFERADRRAQLEAGIGDHSLRVGCTPAVNLWEQAAEPVLLTQRRPEYLLVADARRRATTEIYSVDSVVAMSPSRPEPIPVAPLYGRLSEGGGGDLFWVASRRASAWRGDGGRDVYLSFVDRAGVLGHPEADSASVRVTCHNGDLPSRLPIEGTPADFELEGVGPVVGAAALVRPTPPLHPPLGRPQLWRLVSQLSLNHLSLGEGGTAALREILRLHNTGESPAHEQQIDALLDVRSEPAVARVSSALGVSFARGRRVEVTLDEEAFAGGGAYLFASVLEHFLGLYAAANSFSQLTARTRQRKGALGTWAPRSGWKALL